MSEILKHTVDGKEYEIRIASDERGISVGSFDALGKRVGMAIGATHELASGFDATAAYVTGLRMRDTLINLAKRELDLLAKGNAIPYSTCV